MRREHWLSSSARAKKSDQSGNNHDIVEGPERLLEGGAEDKEI